MKMSILEAGMILCFGASWPVAIRKTLKTKSVHGKSRMFLFLVLSGYGLGILHKIFFNLDFVLILYVFNFTMVLVEICLCCRYRTLSLQDSSTAALDEEEYSAADTLLAE